MSLYPDGTKHVPEDERYSEAWPSIARAKADEYEGTALRDPPIRLLRSMAHTIDLLLAAIRARQEKPEKPMSETDELCERVLDCIESGVAVDTATNLAADVRLAIDKRDTALAAANALIGEAADEAKRLQDTIDKLVEALRAEVKTLPSCPACPVHESYEVGCPACVREEFYIDDCRGVRAASEALLREHGT